MIYSKLAFKNIKRSIKDYAIYFLTLVFAVAIFYTFNSIESQSFMMQNGESMSIEGIGIIMTFASVLVAFILGFLIVYANNYLIKRRNKEFGIYMTLGMEKGHLSRIIFIETLLIGVVSLVIGLILGIFLSQGLAIVTAKLFKADLNSFKFTFSQSGMIKTILSFGIIYLIVLLFNSFSIRKIKLINLLNAAKKNETVKIRNLTVSVIVFIISAILIGIAYRNIIVMDLAILDMKYIGIQVLLGSVGTILFFFSLSGFLLRIVQSNKSVYLKDLNMFVLRQINSKINTVFLSMSLISIMLFVSICMLASGFGINRALNKDIEELTQFDATIYNYDQIDLYEDLDGRVFDIEEEFKEFSNVKKFNSNLRYSNILDEKVRKDLSNYYFIKEDKFVETMNLSTLNELLVMAGKESVQLSEDEYLILYDVWDLAKNLKEIKDSDKILNINGRELKPKNEILKFVTYNQILRSNVLTLVVNDEVNEDLEISSTYLVVNYKNKDFSFDKYKDKNNEDLISSSNGESSHFMITANEVMISSMGIGTIISYLGIYIGGIMLIASVAILALQQLSESNDNKERYGLLRKIGADEKIINKSLFMQIAIYFIMPLILALVHSMVGLSFSKKIISFIGSSSIMQNVLISLVIILIIYIGYFIATYLGSKKTINER